MAITISRPGQANSAGDALALFLKVFGGEVFTEFETNLTFKDKHFLRQIDNGKSASFPLIGNAATQRHDAGTQVSTDVIPHAEKVIAVDGKVTSAVSIADIDEAMNHYDVRAPYSRAMGRALAVHYDYNVALSVLLAARSSSPLTSRAGGSKLVDATFGTSGSALKAGLFLAAEALDSKDVPSDARWGIFKPAQFYLLAQLTDLLNTQFGGMGSIAEGTLETVAGITIVKNNRVPITNESANAKLPTNLRINASTNKGLVFTDMAAGSVQLMALQSEAMRRIDYQDHLMVSSFAAGWDFLEPKCAVSLETA